MSRIRIAMVGLAVLFSLQLARGEDEPASQPAKPQPVDFHKLQELTPEEAVGVQRSNLDGENMTMGEWVMSRASANYTKPDSDGSDANANIEIADYVAAPQMLAAMAVWRTVPMNIENDEGYTRTVKFKDYPALEVYTKNGDSRQMLVVVAERFLVNIQTYHVPEADFKALAEGLLWEKLAELK